LLISALLSTLSATASGCFFNGDDIILPMIWVCRHAKSRYRFGGGGCQFGRGECEV
jgi:hypothetical protein